MKPGPASMLRVLGWTAYGVAILFVWAYVATWALFDLGLAWLGGVVVALALTTGSFLWLRSALSER